MASSSPMRTSPFHPSRPIAASRELRSSLQARARACCPRARAPALARGADRAVPRSARAPRPEIQRGGHHHARAGAQPGAARGGRDRGRALPRTPPRHSLWRQGSPGHHGHADDMGRRAPSRAALRLRRHRHPQARRGGGRSSSGSGAAVAAGLVPFAIGSETWGSILSPAGYCGLAGLRPTYGRVSRRGAMALCWTLDKLGPLALTADDCGLVLEAIAGADPADPTASERPYRYEAADRRGFRFGVIADVTDGCEEPVIASFRRSLDDLGKIGMVEEVALPDLPYEQITRTILQVEAISAFEDLIESGGIAELTAPEDRFTPYAREAILAHDYLKAVRLRGLMAREIDRVISRFDALVAPGRINEAPRLGQEFRSAIRATAKDVMGAVGNGAGLPAVCVPNGVGARGLPTSL